MFRSMTRCVREEETARFAEVRTTQSTDAVSFGIAQVNLPLGDFLWVSTQDTQQQGNNPASPVVDLDEEEIPKASVRRYAIERKTYKDLAGRFGNGDHLKQLRRLSASSIVTSTFILLEGNLELSASHDTYGSHNVGGIQPEQVDAIAVDCVLNIGECAGSKTLFTVGEVDTATTLLSMTRIIRDQFYEELALDSEEKDSHYETFRKQCSKESKQVAENTLERTKPVNVDALRQLLNECINIIGVKTKVTRHNLCSFLAPVLHLGGVTLNSTRQHPFPCTVFNCNGVGVPVAVVHCMGCDLLGFICRRFFATSSVDVTKPSHVLRRIKELAAMCDEGLSGGGMPSRRLLILEKLAGTHGAIRSKMVEYRNVKRSAHSKHSTQLDQKIKMQAEFFVTHLNSVVYDFYICLILRHGFYFKQSTDHKQTCRFLSVMAMRSLNVEEEETFFEGETVDLVESSESESEDDEVIDLSLSQGSQ